MTVTSGTTVDVSAVDRASVVALVGNPRTGSRTADLARRLTEALAEELWPQGASSVEILDLAGLSETLGVPLGPDTAERWAAPLAALLGADLVVVASPVYKASYSGLLKSFLDQVDAGALRGRVAVPVMTPGSPAHSLAVDVHLRPLLLELGAAIPSRSLVVQASQLEDPSTVLDEWLTTEVPAIRRLLVPPAHPAGRLVARRPDAHLPV